LEIRNRYGQLSIQWNIIDHFGCCLVFDSVTNEDANINVVLVPDLICAEVPLGFVDGQKVRFRGNVPNVGTDFQAKIELKPCAD